jgi:1,4-alpha-glucan branching enzyme
MNNYLGLILTGHVPYLRAAGRHPDGEDALHETIAQAIVPLLNVLFDFRELGLRPAVALAYSPVLLEQLGDIVVQKHFVMWMEQWLDRVAWQHAHWNEQRQEHHGYLARFYLDWGQGILRSFVDRYNRNLVAALRELCADGTIEPLAGVATHAYLPLLGRTESLRTQFEIGTLNVMRHLGRWPRGLWLPECGYRPEFEQQMLSTGARYFIADPSSLVSGATIAHLRPRWVTPRRLAMFQRDVGASAQIWSEELGYPGDPLYRALRREPQAGLALWRNGIDGAAEQLYDPYDAFKRAQEHASHFSAYITAELEAFFAHTDHPGIAIIPLDAELLGRRWFEGPTWLRALLEEFVGHPTITLTTPSAYLRAYRPRQAATLRDGSWGQAGDHRAWSGRAALPLLQAIQEAEERLALLVRRFPNAQGHRERILAQALRELLLAQSSDWLLLLTQGANDAALQRPQLHLERCGRLCVLAEVEQLSEQELAFLEQVEEFDNPFPNLNYRVFVGSS